LRWLSAGKPIVIGVNVRDSRRSKHRENHGKAGGVTGISPVLRGRSRGETQLIAQVDTRVGIAIFRSAMHVAAGSGICSREQSVKVFSIVYRRVVDQDADRQC